MTTSQNEYGPYFLMMLARKHMAVRVMDLISTLFLAVIGVCACARLKGLKLRTAEMILLAMDALLLTSDDRLFNVAVTISASLQARSATSVHCHVRLPAAPAVVLNHAEQAIQQTRSLCLQIRRRYYRMIARDQGQRYLILIRTLYICQ